MISRMLLKIVLLTVLLIAAGVFTGYILARVKPELMSPLVGFMLRFKFIRDRVEKEAMTELEKQLPGREFKEAKKLFENMSDQDKEDLIRNSARNYNDNASVSLDALKYTQPKKPEKLTASQAKKKKKNRAKRKAAKKQRKR